MNTCNHCHEFIKKTNHSNIIDLRRSFTKIDGQLHLGMDRSEVCPIMTDYIPETIILAGNGAVESKNGEDCWTALRNQMIKESLLGPEAYQKEEDVLTWLAAQYDFFKRTINSEGPLREITKIKQRIVQTLQRCDTSAREICCFNCQRMFRFPDSKNILMITTNWDLGLFNNFNNVVQLHGRCDYAEQAILPLQNISLLMPQVKEDFKKLNCGILPGTFLERCLKKTKNFIFWGTALNEYDAALWHFIRGFLKANSNVQLGVGTLNDEESYITAKERVMRFFPTLPINDCLCHMLPLNS